MNSNTSQLYSQFVSQKVRRIRWMPKSDPTIPPDRFVTGSWDDGGSNAVAIWRIQEGDEGMAQGELEKDERTMRFHPGRRRKIGADVSDLKVVSEDGILAGRSNGSLIYLIESGLTNSLEEIVSWKELHKIGPVPCSLTAISVWGSEVVTCGENGKLCKVDLANEMEVNLGGQQKDTGGMYCIQHYSKNEIVTGCCASQLEVWDLRKEKGQGPALKACIQIGTQRANAVTSVAVHPGQNHQLAAGTQQGSVGFCDLRQPKMPASSVLAVHSGAVWETKFHNMYPENLFTCSDDGSILHWDASVLKLGTLRHAEENKPLNPWMLGAALADKVNLSNLNPDQILSINSLDVFNDCVICGSDSETVDFISGLVIK